MIKREPIGGSGWVRLETERLDACSLRVLFCALVLLWLIPGSSLMAQTANTGAITGTVKDASGGIIPGVSVQINQTDTGETRETITGTEGLYGFQLLAPGSYRIKVSMPGFKTVIRDGVTVRVTETSVVDVALEVSTRDEVVTITGEASILQTNSPAMGRVVDSRQITELPLVTRNFTQLSALSPGTTMALPDSSALGKGTRNVFTNGVYQLGNSYTINGVDANNPYTNSASNSGPGIQAGVSTPSVETIHEFKVQTGLYDASYGRNAGANVAIVTRSGTSAFHGSLYEFFRNEALNANQFFFNSLGTPRPILRQNQFGGTVGGPVLKDRLFFFSSYEGTRQLNGSSLSSTRQIVLPPVPPDRSPASLGAVFGGQTGIRGGLAIAPDGSNIHPVALRLLNYKLPGGEFLLPSPQHQGPGVNYAVSIPAVFHEDQFNANLDYKLSERNRLAGKYFFADSIREEGIYNGINLPGFPTNIDFDNQNLSLGDTHFFGARTINEARLGYTRTGRINNSGEALRDTDVGMFRPYQDVYPAMPSVIITGAYAFGTQGNNSRQVTNTFSFGDVLSFRWGRHELRAGAETKRLQVNINTFRGQQVGVMRIQSFADFLLGRRAGPIDQGGNGTTFSNINQINIAATARFNYRATRAWDQSFFLADDWKVHPRLTLNLGLRWEFLGDMWDAHGYGANFDPRLYRVPPAGGFSSAGWVLPENTAFPLEGIPLVNKTFLDSSDRNNFAPRFGFAYQSWKNTVIRGGYGIYYDKKSFLPVIQESGLIQAPLLRNGIDNAASTLDNPFPPVPPPDSPISLQIIPGPPFAGATVSRGFLDPLSRTPYFQSYSLNVQYAFTNDLLLEMGYVGSRGTKLYLSITKNQAALASPEQPINGVTTNTPANAVMRAQWLGFANTTWSNENTGISNYNSLQASLTKRMSHGLGLLASYTYSKSLGTVDGGDAFGDFAGSFGNLAQDQHNVRGTGYGSVGFDRTHRFVTSFLYELPFYRGSTSALQKVFGGWQLSGVWAVQSGPPYGIGDSTAGTLYGNAGGRASFAAGATAETATLSGSTQSRLNQYFNPAAFVRAPTVAAGQTTPDGFPVSQAGTIFGNTGSNILRGPGQSNLDLGVSKRVRLGEERFLEFRTEFFNALNQTNFGLPGTAIATPATFGVISSTTAAPRVIQFGLRFLF
jgi:Carboxypeptidase regulatory-like domain